MRYRKTESWQLDESCHRGIGRLFTSVFYPDFAIGLNADPFDSASPLFLQFLLDVPKIIEPSANVLTSCGRTFACPFFIWERKSDTLGESLKARNQLGLPVVKSLDILKAIELPELPVIALVTIGSLWEIWIAHNCIKGSSEYRVSFQYLSTSKINCSKYVLQYLFEGNFNTHTGATRLLCALQTVKNYAVTSFLPLVTEKLLALKMERWQGNPLGV
jgi:hypothetical protein